ncbi:hypothetical protein FJU08_11645 [Martelella alba]|uniref:Uncharacterized protein n=1 Tax=Martelella alba TaxID=2590451 RepID=A0A506UAE4_9HYPH|nr:hypothetical protein [Martelella alba]TPW30326.1 hypothetical protein FJU08_11645 [Martelella alba]
MKKNETVIGRKLGRKRQKLIVARLCLLIREEFDAGRIGSLFGLEGTLRAAVRGTLCKQGWRWSDADNAALGVLSLTFMQLGASRPSWNEGQPEWTITSGSQIERRRCMRCHNPLPEGRYKFCSRLCKSSYGSRIVFLMRGRYSRAAAVAASATQ